MIYIKWSVLNRCFAHQHTSKNASTALGQTLGSRLENDVNEAIVMSFSVLDHISAEA